MSKSRLYQVQVAKLVYYTADVIAKDEVEAIRKVGNHEFDYLDPNHESEIHSVDVTTLELID